MGALRETFAPLQNRNLRLYLGGQAVSLIGTWMQSAAQSWVVWRLTGSEAALGTVAMLATLPVLLLGPIAGSLADRWDRRKILIYTQTLAMVLAFVLSALVLTGVVQIWHVYLLALLLGCLTALDMPSAQAFIGDMAGTDLVRKAVVINGMIVQVSRILGPAVAGLVVRAIGEGPAFFFNGVSFIGVIASLFVVRAGQAHGPGGQRKGGTFIETVRFAVSQPRVLDLMVFTALITFFGFSNGTILPAFATETLHGDAGLYGMIMSASGVGGLVSTFLVVPWAQRIRRTGVMLTVAVAWAGLFIALYSLTRVPWLAMVGWFFAGIPFPLVLTTNNGLLQVLAPGQMRGRLLTLYLMFSFGLQPIANLWVGLLAEYFGAPLTILVNGLAMLTIALLMLLRPGLLSWEAPVGRHGPGAVPGPGPQPGAGPGQARL